jgi:hypothetical protein
MFLMNITIDPLVTIWFAWMIFPDGSLQAFMVFLATWSLRRI